MSKSSNLLQLDRSVPFVDAVLGIIEGTGTVREAIEILLQAEDTYHVEFLVKPYPEAKEMPEELYGSYVEGNLFGFLSATQLVLGSYDYDKLTIIFGDGFTYTLSHRAWGAMMAEWANRTHWLGVSKWDYTDFYMGPNDAVIQNYTRWSEIALRLIEFKTGK